MKQEEKHTKQTTALVKAHQDHPLVKQLAQAGIELSEQTVKTMDAIAKHWGWNSSTLARRMETALVTVDAQVLYITWAIHYRIHPETLAEIIAVYQGKKKFYANIFQEVYMDSKKTLVYSRGNHFAEFLKNTLELLNKRPLNRKIQISARVAALVAKAYGEHTEDLLEDILANAQLVRQKLGIVSEDEMVILSHCLYWFAGLIARGEEFDVPSVYDFIQSRHFDVLTSKYNRLVAELQTGIDVMEAYCDPPQLPEHLKGIKMYVK